MSCVIDLDRGKGRFYKSNGVLVFDVFATKNATSGQILAELIFQALISIHKVNAIVKNTKCDGYSAKKFVCKHLGVTGKTSWRKTLHVPSPGLHL
jgi:hypothetical protein